MTIGGKYNWIGQPERLIYLGKRRGWHQFAKVQTPFIVWCEITDDQLSQIEETK